MSKDIIPHTLHCIPKEMTSTPVKVYGPPLSTAVSRVLACLLEKQVHFELINVNMSKGEHKSPDYLKIQPFGQVPAFQDDNFTLFGNYKFPFYVSIDLIDSFNLHLLIRTLNPICLFLFLFLLLII